MFFGSGLIKNPSSTWRCCTSGIREMQIKTTKRYHYTLIRMVKKRIETEKNRHCQVRRTQSNDSAHTLLSGMQNSAAIAGRFGSLLQNSTRTYHVQTYVHLKNCTQILAAALVRTAQNETTQMSISWIHKLWHLAIKKTMTGSCNNINESQFYARSKKSDSKWYRRTVWIPVRGYVKLHINLEKA